MNLRKLYRQSLIYPSVILLIISVLYPLVYTLLLEKEAMQSGDMLEIVLVHLATALIYCMIMCILGLTIFLNRVERVRRSKTLSALSWFLLPGGFMLAVFGKAINEYITVDSSWEIGYAAVANVVFLTALIVGFRKSYDNPG
jgi:hypothetical protein